MSAQTLPTQAGWHWVREHNQVPGEPLVLVYAQLSPVVCLVLDRGSPACCKLLWDSSTSSWRSAATYRVAAFHPRQWLPVDWPQEPQTGYQEHPSDEP